MPLRQRFESLLLFDPNRSPATVNVSISHPSPSEEQALGKLVVVSSIAGHDLVNLDIISLVQDELRSSYYQAVDAKPERAFEQALHQTNKRLHQVITDGVSAWIEQASLLVAVVWRETMIISSVGSMHAYLLRRSLRDGRASFGIHNILNAAAEPVNPVRVFPHTISGQLQAGDQVLFCTPTLLDYFSLEKLRRTLADGRPDEAVHHWETTLLGVEQQSAFAAVVIQSLALDQIAVPQSRPEAQSTLTHSAPQVSMEHLIAKEEATKRLLSPSIWPAVRDVIAQLWLALSRLVRKIIFRKPPRRVLSSGIQRPAPPLPTRTKTWQSGRRGLSIFFITAIKLFRSIVPRKVTFNQPTTNLNVAPSLQKKWRPSLSALVVWFQGLTKRQQALSAASLLLVVVLTVAIFPRAANQDNAQVASATTIADELAKAKAALLYGGDETAATNLATARTLYDKLPGRSGKDKEAKQSALAEINDVAKLLARISTISAPTVVAQFATVAPQAEPQQLYNVGTRLVVLDPERSIAITANADGTGAPEVQANTLDTGNPKTGTSDGATSVIFTTDRQGFIELNASTGVWKPLDSAWPTSQQRIQSIAFYQSRLYALDPANNDIVRFARSTNSLGAGALWLKESAPNLANARALAVDGSIYTLQPNGAVDIYTNGRRGTLSLAMVEPALTDATRLWTDTTSTKLYLVDSSQKRIVVFTKAGKLLNQYQSDAWSNLRDIAIVEKTKTAYVLSGTTVTSFTLLQ